MNKQSTYRIAFFIFLLALGWASPVAALSGTETNRFTAANDVTSDGLNAVASCYPNSRYIPQYGEFYCEALAWSGSGEYTFEWSVKYDDPSYIPPHPDPDPLKINYNFEAGSGNKGVIIGVCTTNKYFIVTVKVIDDITEDEVTINMRRFCY